MRQCQVGMLALLILVAWIGAGYASDIDSLIQDLKHGDESARIRAVLALGQSGDPQAVEVLREAMHDESQLVRKYALYALRDLLQVLERTSRLVTRWLHDLLDRVEQQLEERPIPALVER